MTAPRPSVARLPSESWRQDVFVAAATFTAGVLGYGFSLVLSHALGPSGFGELSALLAVAIMASVPGVALQAGIARSIAASPQHRDDVASLRRSTFVAVAVGGLLLLATPLLGALLDVHSPAGLLWLAALMVPTTLAFGCFGVLQGRRRFIALGWLLVLVQAAKLVGGVFAAATGTGIDGALAGATVVTAVVVAVACADALPAPSRSHLTAGLRNILRPRRIIRLHRVGREGGVLARDAVAMLGVLLLSNLDLVLARHYLPSHEAGLYAAGNLVTKVAFWGPSFISTIAYPRLANADERRPALARAAGMLGALAIVTTVGALVAAPLMPAVVGQAYRPIVPLVWLFALQGAALAGVLLGVYAGLAVRDRRLATLVWLVAAAEAGAVALHWHGSIRQVLAIVLCGSATLLIAAAGQLRRPLRRPLLARS